MSYWQTNFDEVKEAYSPVFEVLEKAFSEFGIDYYLIGAQARDVWTHHLNLNARVTRDIDYSVYIGNYEEWNALNEYLLAEGFSRDGNQPYRFYYKGFTIDLLPFGGIEENGEVILKNPTTELSVYGCKEVIEDAIIIHDKYKVITLPGLCIMKLLAFNERPDRTKDMDDFLLILFNYHKIAGEQLFEDHHDDLIENDFELPVASARLLGRHMQSILNKNENLKNRIVAILKERLGKFSDEDIKQMYNVRDEDDKQVEQMKLISEAIRGINDEYAQN